MVKEKLNKILNDYGLLLKKYGIYMLVILFIFGLTLTTLLKYFGYIGNEKEKEITKVESQDTNNNPAEININAPTGLGDHKDAFTESPLTKASENNNNLVTSHQSPVTNSQENNNNSAEIKTNEPTRPRANKDTITESLATKASENNNNLVTSHQSPITNLSWPVQGEVITTYGLRYSETFADYRVHPGIDIKTKEGTEIKACLKGKVILIENSKAQKVTIEIDHGGGWLTRYCHLEKSLVKEGDYVQTGQVIGIVGEPGLEEYTEGCHLHLEVKEDQQWIDPLTLLKE